MVSHEAYTLQDRANEKWSIYSGHIFIAAAVYLYIFGGYGVLGLP